MLRRGGSFRPAAPSQRAWQQQQLWPTRHVHSPAARWLAASARPVIRRPPSRTVTAALRRWETTASTGEDKSGHITAAPDEGLLFLDSIFPLRLGSLLAKRPWRTSAESRDHEIARLQKRFRATSGSGSGCEGSSDSPPTPGSPAFAALTSWADPVCQIKRALPTSLGVTITEIVPRRKDGGVFVKFRPPVNTAPEAVERLLAAQLLAKPVRPWFSPVWGCMHAGLVRGVPWLEDLSSRVPSCSVRVEFCAPLGTAGAAGPAGDASGTANLELSHETLYGLFRRYGKIAEIRSLPSDAKTLPRYATVDFLRRRDAVMARSCLHGFVAAGGATRLRISYEPRPGIWQRLWDMLAAHPRIVVPLLAALLATVTVAIFDPVRVFFVRAHVQRAFSVRDSDAWRWAAEQTRSLFALARRRYRDATADSSNSSSSNNSSDSADATLPTADALMTHRRDLLDALHTWLLETAGTFVVVQGPRGSGKKELVVDQALNGRRNVLVLDCKPIVEARGERATLQRLAAALGYRPVFAWASSISGLVDLAVQGAAGVKPGLSETLDEQLAKVLATAKMALRDVSLAGRRPDDADAALAPDAYLEAHPERRAVVVLDNFGQRNEDASGPVYSRLAAWAAALVQGNLAHVVFLTSDTAAYPKALVEALPDRLFRQIALGDLSPDVALNYVLSHLAATDEGGGQEQQQGQQEQEEQKEQKEQQGQQKLQKQKPRPDTADTAAAHDKAAMPVSASTSSYAGGEQAWRNAAAAKAVLHAEGGVASVVAAPSTSAIADDHQQVVRELDGCIGVLGGRLTDLESLVRRLKSGQSPKRAVSEIVEQSASEILKMFLLPSASQSSEAAAVATAANRSSISRRWTTEQAWHLVREIAARGGSVSYHDILLSDTFAALGSPAAIAAIDALAAAELVTVRAHRGRPQSIRAGSPVYLAAFQLLGSDAALAARLDRCVLAGRARCEAQNVVKAEQELSVLGQLPKQPAPVAERAAYLMRKLQASQAKIAAYEAEMARLKILMSEEC